MSVVQKLPETAIELGGRSKVGDFPLAIRIGDAVYIGSQVSGAESASDPSAIEAPTHATFRGLVRTLEAVGLGMADLVKLHTYYVYEGEGSEVTRFWERMTQVRLQYLANPGPAATALRVRGVPTRTRLITVDGIATLSRQRRRLMPAHAWDWSIPTPFSQGWLVGEKVYVGGQISADRHGKALGVGDVETQTRNTLDYIRHVLLEAGADWKDVVTLKIAYRHDGREAAASELLNQILAVVRQALPSPGPALVCFGVDLLYEGLLLEIDAVAIRSSARHTSQPANSRDWIRTGGFSDVVRVGNEAFISGISAPGAASIQAQTEATTERILAVTDSAGHSASDLVKLNVYFVCDDRAEDRESTEIARILGEYMPSNRPVVSIVRVASLPHPGQKVQIDGIAVANTR